MRSFDNVLKRRDISDLVRRRRRLVLHLRKIDVRIGIGSDNAFLDDLISVASDDYKKYLAPGASTHGLSDG
jgi:hypothetical protein